MELQPTFRLRRYYTAIIPLLQKPKTRAYTMITLSFFTIAIFGAFAIRPTLSTIINLQRKLADQQQVDQQMQDKINKLRIAQVEYASLENSFTALFAAIPSSPQMSQLIGKINRVLVNANIDLTLLQFSAVPITSPATDVNGFSQIQFTLTAKGPYDNVLQLITLLTSMDRLITIDRVSIAAPTQSGQSTSTTNPNTLTVTIQGKAFELKEAKGGGNG